MCIYIDMSRQTDTAITDFPPIKLSYETFSHKKVHDADIILAIPQGKKCFVWFTTRNNNKVCYLLELGQRKEIVQVHLYPACFDKELSYGSIFYGTWFTYNNSPFVAMEDIYTYKGRNVHHTPYESKLALFEHLFSKELKQVSPGRNFVSFGMPLFHSDHTELMKLISPRQRIMYFQYRYKNKNTIYRVKPYIVLKPDTAPETVNISSTSEKIISSQHARVPHQNPTANRPSNGGRNRPNYTVPEKVFTVSADIQNDIYHLHDEKGTYVDVAYIPDYKTSVMMNKLFRNIKENDNLDTLEESDDEDEFESDRVDKFVHLDKQYSMTCAYHNKFKKWVPTRIRDTNQHKIISR